MNDLGEDTKLNKSNALTPGDLEMEEDNISDADGDVLSNKSPGNVDPLAKAHTTVLDMKSRTVCITYGRYSISGRKRNIQAPNGLNYGVISYSDLFGLDWNGSGLKSTPPAHQELELRSKYILYIYYK